MRNAVLAATVLALALTFAPMTAGSQPASAGAEPEATPQPAAPAPYKPVAVKVPPLVNDPSLDAFRKEVATVAQRRDRAALARMVVAKGFFWERDDGGGADKGKSGVDNLAVALDLDASAGAGAGWDALGKAVGEAHAAPDPQKKGVMCAPPAPDLNGKDFEALVEATKTDPNEWGFAYSSGAEVRSDPKPDAPVVEKLGPALVRVTVDESPLHAVEGVSAEWLRVVAPSGKVGYVAATAIGALVADQICYVKDAGGWRIAGIVGGGDQH